MISQQDLNEIGIKGRFINVSCSAYIVSVHQAFINKSDRRPNLYHVENRWRAPASGTDVSCMDVYSKA